MKKTSQKKEAKAEMRELTDAELVQVSGGKQEPPFNTNKGGGPGGSGNGDQNGNAGPPP